MFTNEPKKTCDHKITLSASFEDDARFSFEKTTVIEITVM